MYIVLLLSYECIGPSCSFKGWVTIFDLWFETQYGMQVQRYHNNEGHGENTPTDKYSQWESRDKMNVSEN